jgi:hypothetical protein
MDEELAPRALVKSRTKRLFQGGVGLVVGLATGAPLGMQATNTGVDSYGQMPKDDGVTASQLIPYVGTGTYNYGGKTSSF